MTSLTATWSFPTEIRFGPGRIAELADVAGRAGMTSPLLVTDRGLAGSEMATRIAAMVSAPVFSDVQSNPTEANLAAGIEAYRAGGHDGVIALGGGSALDLGKLIAFQQAQARPVWDFEDVGDWWTRAESAGIAPVIAVPTTAGTGSEVGRAAVLTNTAHHVKKVIFHPRMLPVTVIADPELTLGLPAVLTAGTGMDAFAHCLEAYSAPGYHPMAEGIAVEGIRLVAGNLRRAYETPGDIEARAHMMSAAAMGAVAFQKGLGAVHALSHPIGALFDTHHGMTNAVLVPMVLKANRPAIEAKIARLADFLNISGGFEGFLGFVTELRAALSVPLDLGQLGVSTSACSRIAEMAPHDPTAGGNPVPVTPDYALRVLEDAFGN